MVWGCGLDPRPGYGVENTILLLFSINASVAHPLQEHGPYSALFSRYYFFEDFLRLNDFAE